MRVSQTVTTLAPDAHCDDGVSLSYEARFLRRKKLTSDKGEAFLVELAETQSVNSGDAFVLDDGRLIAVKPEVEALVAVRHHNLSRMAWHIGNRHTPCQFGDDVLLVQRDKVLENMLITLDAMLTPVDAPFTPEGGAYGHGRTLNHSHGETHGETHGENHGHSHSYSHS